MKLDAKTVAALKLDGKTDVIFFDDAMPGFGYRLRASGSEVRKSWVVQYRRAGATRRMLLGSAEVLTAEAARAAAKKVLAKVALGEDPSRERATRRSADKFTLAAMVEEFLVAKKGSVRPRTFHETQRYLRGPYFKPLLSMPADQITRRDIAARLLVISRESGNTTAARARSAFSELYAWGMGQGLVENNPIVGTVRPKISPPRARTLSDIELLAVWSAAGDDDFGRIVKLLICTGARRAEVGSATWGEFDLSAGAWTIPGGRAKNHHQYVVPLGSLALDVIRSTPRVLGRDNLFGTRASGGFTSWAGGKRQLDARLGDQVKKWTLHDLRRSFCTRLGDLGVLPHAIEAAVNHHSGFRSGVAGTYNRSPYEREVKAAFMLWDAHVRALIEGKPPTILPFERPAANVGGAS
jgi:integrase